MRAGPAPASTPASDMGARGEPSSVESFFAGVFGLLLGVGLLKFGNPVILDHLVGLPRSLDEWRAFAWPVRVGHVGIGVALAAGIGVVGTRIRPNAPPVLVAALLAWLGWQFAAAVGTVDPVLTPVVVLHFACCVACWALGHLALSRVAEPRVFWLCLAGGFVGVLGMAMDQRFGGLEATRRMIFESPDAAQLPAEYLARIRSNRVFGTLVYPNALAGAILLLLPPTVVLAHQFGSRWGPRGGRGLGGLLLGTGLMVLVWSGSKAGWLLAMGMALVLLFHARWDRRLKLGTAVAFLGIGLVGFGLLYGDRLRRGATSVAARFDYWEAAVQGFKERPLIGNGPGAFKKIYGRYKRAESEMAQLAHNDYLQQATDSGIPGLLTYGVFVVGSLGWLYRERGRRGDRQPPKGCESGVVGPESCEAEFRRARTFEAAVWLGLAAWFAQGLVEFGLYIPATSWAAFALLGWLMARPRGGDNSFRRPAEIA
jgi:O-antigen ligase